MAKGEEEWKSLIGSNLYIIFDDGSETVSNKRGKLVNVTDTHLILRNSRGKEGILKSNVIRFEVKGGGGGE